MANRMTIGMNYFWRADPDWLSRVVLKPMLDGRPNGIHLWEAFAKYAPIPRSDLWELLRANVIQHIARAQLSNDALRRLTEMAIVVWSWTKGESGGYSLNVASLRGALSVSTQAVRAAAAWQFIQSIGLDADEEEDLENPTTRWPGIGKQFFAEVWPLEPALQSPQSAKNFARIPIRSGKRYYIDAIRTVIPF